MSGREHLVIWRVYIGDAIGRVGHLELGRGLVGEGASLRGAGDGGGGGGGVMCVCVYCIVAEVIRCAHE